MKNPLESLIDIFFGRKLMEIQCDGYSLEVLKKNKDRLLYYKTPSSSILFSKLPFNSIYTRGYWDSFLPLPSLFQNPRVLLIGFGGGTIPYQFESVYKQISIDAIDIDKNMIEISKFFLPRQLKTNISVADGVSFVKGKVETYDLIILDAFKSVRTPPGFLSEQFAIDASNALAQKGILAINYVSGVWNIKESAELLSMLKRHFTVFILTPSALAYNKILVCVKGHR